MGDSSVAATPSGINGILQNGWAALSDAKVLLHSYACNKAVQALLVLDSAGLALLALWPSSLPNH